MLDVLRGEGLTDLEFVGVMGNAESWDDPHPDGFDEVTFPLMLDVAGVAFIYGTQDDYAAMLVDKQGRLVTTFSLGGGVPVTEINQRLRELHEE
jgi:hypothetical protein